MRGAVIEPRYQLRSREIFPRISLSFFGEICHIVIEHSTSQAGTDIASARNVMKQVRTGFKAKS